MIFCGIEKNSLNDYPGKICCVVFTGGCNFFCPYCHNPQTVLNASTQGVSEEEFLGLINKRRNLYDGIAISGGEPTLHKWLPDICRKVKDMGYQIKLDTNGSRPNMLSKLLKDKLVDYVAMDIKTDLSEASYSQFTKEPNIISSVEDSIELIMDYAPDYEFRTTCVNPLMNKDKMSSICQSIRGAKRYRLQPYNVNAESILNKEFFVGHVPRMDREVLSELVEVANLTVNASTF